MSVTNHSINQNIGPQSFLTISTKYIYIVTRMINVRYSQYCLENTSISQLPVKYESHLLAILRLFPGKLLNIFLLIPAFKHIKSKKIKVKPCVNVHYSATTNLSPCAMVNVNLITRQQVNTESLISKYIYSIIHVLVVNRYN